MSPFQKGVRTKDLIVGRFETQIVYVHSWWGWSNRRRIEVGATRGARRSPSRDGSARRRETGMVSLQGNQCESWQVGLSIPEGGAIGRRLLSLVVPVIVGGGVE